MSQPITSITSNNTPKQKPKDIYSETPVRLLGFTNEVGAAMSPLIGPVGELATYAPALAYIAMDTKDKYQRGADDTYEKPCHKRATKQLIFQMMASVIFPTAAVKASQAIANKIIDSSLFQPYKEDFQKFIKERKEINNFLNRFADKSHTNKKHTKLQKFAHGFEKVLNHITIAPLFFKAKQNKTGQRNVLLAVIGLTTLATVIKPIDHLSEKIIAKAIAPAVESAL